MASVLLLPFSGGFCHLQMDSKSFGNPAVAIGEQWFEDGWLDVFLFSLAGCERLGDGWASPGEGENFPSWDLAER